MGTFMGLLIAGVGFGVGWHVFASLGGVGVAIMIAGGILGLRDCDEIAACRKLLRAYKKAHPTEREWKRWSHSKTVAPLLLEWLESDVPLLRGDLKRLRHTWATLRGLTSPSTLTRPGLCKFGIKDLRSRFKIAL